MKNTFKKSLIAVAMVLVGATAAMAAGSKFGWDDSAADPKTYEIDEKLMKRKSKDRGDAR